VKTGKHLLDLWSRPGDTPSGKLNEVFQDLGVTEEMKPKVVYHNVVDGGVEYQSSITKSALAQGQCARLQAHPRGPSA
jgi:hypothetical protein